MEKQFKVTGSNILIEWIKSDSKILIDPKLRQTMDFQLNRTPKVIAVGSKVTECKPGDYVLLSNGGNLVEFEGKTYVLVKECYAEMIFNYKPDFDTLPEVSNGVIKTEKTEQKIIDMNSKYDIN